MHQVRLQGAACGLWGGYDSSEEGNEIVNAGINDDENNFKLFSEQVENDPDLAEELRAVEQELAKAYPDDEEEQLADNADTNE